MRKLVKSQLFFVFLRDLEPFEDDEIVKWDKNRFDTPELPDRYLGNGIGGTISATFDMMEQYSSSPNTISFTGAGNGNLVVSFSNTLDEGDDFTFSGSATDFGVPFSQFNPGTYISSDPEAVSLGGVTLQVVPEPTTSTLIFLSGISLLIFRKR